MAILGNHLWQSTWFAVAAGLLTLAFRRNHAPVRFWIWFSASCKFLVPFGLFAGIGSLLPAPQAHTVAQQPIARAVIQVTELLSEVATPAPVVAHSPEWVAFAVLLLWGSGFLAVALFRFRGWLRIRAAVRASRPQNLSAAVEVRSAPGLLEPGVVGLWRPILLVPEGIGERLAPPQLEAVLAHELCHVRRRDNLFAAIHMLVEALFWFHPLVWWVGKKMVEERERACDEEVLRLGGEPQIYAEAIVKICKLYMESPLVCMSGVTGSDLKKRVEAIMLNRGTLKVNFAKKLALLAAGMAALAAPIVVGIWNAPAMKAQSPAPGFEVASIKLCGALDGGRGASGGAGESPDRLLLNCLTVAELIRQAYITGAPAAIAGGPSWINTERYRIDAKAEAPQSRKTLSGPMLQALLEDRFQLRTHRESREVPVYELTVAKGGSKLQPSSEASCESSHDKIEAAVAAGERPRPCGVFLAKEKDTPGLLSVNTRGVTLSSLCEMLSRMLDRPVADKTGIQGKFDLHAAFSPDESTVAFRPGGAMTKFAGDSILADPPGPSLLAAFQQQLGLKLEPAKGPREFLVIDHVNHPTGN
jgi:uncharacterized protein (TIGR03435 family)